MKTLFTVGALFSASAGIAAAQGAVVKPEQEMVIREYVTTHQVEPSEVPADVTIEVGTTLPETIDLHTIDAPDLDVVIDTSWSKGVRFWWNQKRAKSSTSSNEPLAAALSQANLRSRYFQAFRGYT